MIPPGGRTLIAATCGMMWLCGAALGAWPPKPEASGTEIVESLFREVERVAVADKNAARRAWAWRALRNVESPAIADLYPTGLADPFPPVRVETLNSLSWLVDEENAAGDAARRAVVAALSDPDPQVRLAAAELVSYSNATE
ncbi:MAG TPA: hypothetical protein VGE52_10775, partial [Pirellulales bacterium]